MVDKPIKLVNENGHIVGKDPISGDTIPVEFESVSQEQLQYALNNTGFSGRLSGRPIVTESETILKVGTDTSTIQEALNQIPLIIRHNFEIQVPDGTYNENLLVPPFLVADSVGKNRETADAEGASHVPRINGNINTPTKVEVNSFTITGTQGAIAPLIEGFSIIGTAPYADEDAGIEVYGSQDVSFRWITFENGTARVGFLPYGSGVTIRQECNLGNNIVKYGVETKHNAHVNIDSFGQSGASFGLEGSATDYAVFNNDSGIVTLGPNDLLATGGIQDVYNREGLMFDATDQRYLPRTGGDGDVESAVGLSSTVVDQSIPGGGTKTKIQFDTAEFDIGGDYDTTNYEFTAPLAGQYELKLQVQWLNPNDTTEMNVEISTADRTTIYSSSRLNGSCQTNPTQHVSRTVSLSSGDTVSFYCTHNEESDLSINTDDAPLTFAEITKIT